MIRFLYYFAVVCGCVAGYLAEIAAHPTPAAYVGGLAVGALILLFFACLDFIIDP